MPQKTAEGQRDRDRQRDRQTDRQTDREGEGRERDLKKGQPNKYNFTNNEANMAP